MSAAKQERGQRLWALFTETPQLTKHQQQRARSAARKWHQPKSVARQWNLDRPSLKHCSFAQRGHYHLTTYFIFSQMTEQDVAQLRQRIENGESTKDLPWPMTYADRIMGHLSWNDRREAWRLFSEGGLP